MYRDGTPRVGVLAPRTQLGLQSLAEKRWRLGFHMVACRRVIIAPLALIFIEHANGLRHHKPIRTLIWLGSNSYGP
jgi:hypothetical protein